MKATIISDLHMDALTNGFPRFDDIAQGVEEAVSHFLAEDGDLFIFGGDLTDPDNVRSHAAVAFAVRTAIRLQDEGKDSIWLVGNHDVVEDGTGSHTLIALKGLGPKVHVFDRPTAVPSYDHGIFLVGFPFTSRALAYDPVDFVAEAKTEHGKRCPELPVLAIGHLHVHGARLGSESRDMSRGRSVVLPGPEIVAAFPDALVVNGHYHKPQRVDVGGGCVVHIPGSLERLRFDEENDDCGWLDLEW